MYENNVTYNKTYQFAIRIVNAYKYLTEEKKEFVLSLNIEQDADEIAKILFSILKNTRINSKVQRLTVKC